MTMFSHLNNAHWFSFFHFLEVPCLSSFARELDLDFILIFPLAPLESASWDNDFCFFNKFLLVFPRFSFLDVDFRTNFLGFDRTTFTTVGWSRADGEVRCESSLLESEFQTNTVEIVAKDREETHNQINI